jgi:hypothetical protein
MMASPSTRQLQRCFNFSNWKYMGAMATAADVVRVGGPPAILSTGGRPQGGEAIVGREAAFVGRSNAGKSSLMNKLVYSKKLGASSWWLPCRFWCKGGYAGWIEISVPSYAVYVCVCSVCVQGGCVCQRETADFTFLPFARIVAGSENVEDPGTDTADPLVPACEAAPGAGGHARLRLLQGAAGTVQWMESPDGRLFFLTQWIGGSGLQKLLTAVRRARAYVCSVRRLRGFMWLAAGGDRWESGCTSGRHFLIDRLCRGG